MTTTTNNSRNEKKYIITCTTDWYHARRNSGKWHDKGNGQAYKVEEEFDDLASAQKELLNMYRNKFDSFAKNWGLAVIESNHRGDGACPTFSDGTRGFSYDIFDYDIVEAKEEEMEEEEI